MATFRAGFALPLEELRDEFDRLWTSLTTAPPLHGWSVGPEGVFPAANVRETADALTVEAELPGLDAGDVEISVTGDELLLQGSRPQAGAKPAGDGEAAGEAAEKVVWHRRERGTGGFERRITLPVAVDPAGVEARLVDGVLSITCPKAPEAKPRRVEVRSA
ncbi:MAG: Hsp20/alpha crystallin family protein [Planctomycetota bacterium]